MPASTLVIVNPRSRNGATGRRWSDVEAKLRASLGPLEVEETRAPRDAERIAREGVRAGAKRLIVAGGDGTTSEVVTGLLANELGEYAELGFLPLGTGGDLARTLNLSGDLDQAIQRIAQGERRTVDAGRIHYRDTANREATAYFMNVASLGLSGVVDQLVNDVPKVLGGRLSFLIGTLRGIARYRNPQVTLRVDGQHFYQGGIVFAVAANGTCFGGGMQIAPEARLDDGLLDIVIAGDMSKRKMLASMPLVYRGEHLDHESVRFRKGRVLEAESDEDVWIDVDGEMLGSLPVRIEVMPKAVTIVGAPI